MERQRQLVVFADYTCPYCYLAEVGLRRLRDDGVPLERSAVELRPAGTELPQPGAAWMRDAWERTIEPLARAFELDMRLPALATRTRKAHEAAAYARAEGALEPMHAAIYRAYWEEGRDIGRIDVLVEIGAAAGLDSGGLRVALDIDQWAERVEQDRATAMRLQLGAVPAVAQRIVADGEPPVWGEILVGLQRYDELGDWVKNDI